MYDTVRVPDHIGTGKVKVTLSLEGWKAGAVAGATLESMLPAGRSGEER